MKINYEAPSTRCEICHQADRFEARGNVCLRCEGVSQSELTVLSVPSVPVQMQFLATYGEDTPSFMAGVIQAMTVWVASFLFLSIGWRLTGLQPLYTLLFWFFCGCTSLVVVKAVPFPVGTYQLPLENAWTDFLGAAFTKTWVLGLVLGLSGLSGGWYILFTHQAVWVAWAACQDEKVLAMVMALGAGVDARDAGQQTPLILSVNDNQAVQRLIAAGADVNASDSVGMTPLMYAATGTDLGILSCLQRNGARLDARDRWGNTALMYAVTHNQYAAARFLNEKKVLINAVNDEGRTVLHRAIREKTDNKIIWYLLDAGADPEFGRPALIEAVSANNLELTGLVLNWEARDLIVPDEKTGGLKWAKYPKVNLHAVDPDSGDTALMIAACQGNPTLVKILLDHFAFSTTINHRNNATALMYAAKSGNVQTVRLILEHLAKLESAMLERKRQAGHLTEFDQLFCKYMKSIGLSVKVTKAPTPIFKPPEWSVRLHLSQTDSSGRTALIYAALNSDKTSRREIVRLLLQAGAEVQNQDKFGRTAWGYTAVQQDLATLKLLEERGAQPQKFDLGEVLSALHSERGCVPSGGVEDFSLVEMIKK